MARQDLAAHGDREVLVAAEEGIERGRLLLALGHQDLGHAMLSFLGDWAIGKFGTPNRQIAKRIRS